ncbi:MAG: NAD-dependent epimerase/dehydratase family protein [Candidatus Heimdallarchaeota archaeon]
MVTLVTGATGFLGRLHINELISKEGINGNEIRILTRPNRNIEDLKQLGIKSFTGDLSKPESLKGIMKDVTTAYHLAAIVVNDSVSRETMLQVNYQGTEALVKEFSKEKSTEKFVLASSIGVYGFNFPKYPVNEEYTIDPQNNYHESKLLAEKSVLNCSYENGIDATAIRNCLITGPYDTVTSLRVANGLLNGDISYLGKGKNKFSLVDGRDSSKAMIMSTKNKVAKGKAYNIKSFDISQREYFNLYAKYCGDSYPKRTVPVWLANLFAWYKEKTTPEGEEVLVTRTRIHRYTSYRMLDTTKIETELGFTPDYSDPKVVINDSIQWLIQNNYLDHPKLVG